MGSKKEDNRPLKEKYRIYFAAGITAWIIFMFIHPVGMAGNAMSPALTDGQIVIVSKDSFKKAPPAVFSIVDFRRDFAETGEKGSNSIRRVLGIPGDTIKIRNGTLYRNGIALEESYAVGKIGDDYGPVDLAEGEIFVLGDNRQESIDSRHLGPMKISDLRGICSIVIWPISDWGRIE